MQDVELLFEWAGELATEMRNEIETLSKETLSWQPAPESNSIGVTVWHVCRWLDLLAVRAIQNRTQAEEQWFTRGWAEKTGYDPRGIGLNGFGAITGYTWAEVEAIPKLTADDLVTYLDQVVGALQGQLQSLSTETLHQPSPGLGGTRSIYDWLKAILKGWLRHLGEIQTLKAIKLQMETSGVVR